MAEKKYHHGDLKQTMIDNGFILLNKEGVEGFSLRKVAAMCGVSHTAPYKHFRDKEELIYAIVGEVWKKFHFALKTASELHPSDSKLRLLEVGKAYVQFMVENPEYLKFMFLSDNQHPIIIDENGIHGHDPSFQVFKDSAESYFKDVGLPSKQYTAKMLCVWSNVHGFSLLIAKKSIEYRGDYLKLAESVISSSL